LADQTDQSLAPVPGRLFITGRAVEESVAVVETRGHNADECNVVSSRPTCRNARDKLEFHGSSFLVASS